MSKTPLVEHSPHPYVPLDDDDQAALALVKRDAHVLRAALRMHAEHFERQARLAAEAHERGESDAFISDYGAVSRMFAEQAASDRRVLAALDECTA